MLLLSILRSLQSALGLFVLCLMMRDAIYEPSGEPAPAEAG